MNNNYTQFWVTLSAVILSCHGTTSSVVAAEASKNNRPNVLMFAVDDLNDWIGCMGGHPQAITPNMDRLAKEGVLFLNNHCQAPICGPSRASLMTWARSLACWGKTAYLVDRPLVDQVVKARPQLHHKIPVNK